MTKRKRKLNKKNLAIVIFTTVMFTIAILVIINALLDIFIRHNYNYENKDNLLNLPKTVIRNEYINGDNFKYYEDDKYTSRLGIDVSAHQKDIDFNKVKNDGISFVFIRLGYRGYSEGHLNLDETFLDNYHKAKEAGLDVGVYFFSHAIDEKEAIDEAYFVRDNIKGLELDLPIVYDLEDIDYDTSRLVDVSGEQRTKNAMAFAAKIEEFGYKPMIYTNLDWTINHYDLEQIMNYDIWYAQYSDYPDFKYYYEIWQYTDSGRVNGIDVPVDINMMLVEK